MVYFSRTGGWNVNWPQAGWYMAIATSLFTYILIHELGHAVAAKWAGVKAEKIVLFPLGGGAYIPDTPEKTRWEVFMYFAGPLANFVLAGLALALLLSQPQGEFLLRYFLNPFGNYALSPTLPERLIGMGLAINLLLGLSNLIPAFPLDGGRIFRALLRKPFGERRATVIATLTGVSIAVILFGVSLLLGDWLMTIGSVFIAALCAVEYRRGWQRRRLAAIPATAVLRDVRYAPPRLYAGDRVANALRYFSTSGWPVLPVFNEWNEQVGFVDKELLEEPEVRATDAVGEYCGWEYATGRKTENLLELVESAVAADAYGTTVYGERGRVIGYVFSADVLPLLKTWYGRLWDNIGGRVGRATSDGQ